MTPEQFIEKWSDSGTRASELMRDDLVDVISAAVAAEHQRTLEQCAKVAEEFECDTYEDGWAEMERGARHCAAIIRALP